ncbi:hypothetical protein B0H19DRAFT_1261992 [Mycena capillaripes]|nr:hypothetical protein B0H19DRAFT_1267795 [Mycena capillaripes]KAJ6555846.1 hypothetical protein B0H19DRAFT_1261992 [Mycena capillaripes]
MDYEPNAGLEFTSHSTFRPLESGFHGTGMLSGAQNFTVTGQTLTNITHYTTPVEPSDFRMIPLGDIDLQREIYVSYGTGIVDRQYERQGVRRLYSARLGGQNTTVAIYQGPGAEEEWRQDTAKYMSVRHPNLVQIRGAANYGGLHATVFYDDLIPLKHFLDLQPSHFLKVYSYASCSHDFTAARAYIYFIFRRRLTWLEYTLWIRHSSGRLCMDLVPVKYSPVHLLESLRAQTQGIYFLSVPTTEATIIESLTLEEYHDICYQFLEHSRIVSISIPITLNLGAVICCPSKDRLKDPVEFAWLPNTKCSSGSWDIPRGVARHITEDCWIRLNSSDVSNTIISLYNFKHPQSWLSQANHIFSRLQITSNFDDYAAVQFEIVISASGEDTPSGFLFLCPTEDLQIGPFSLGGPACSAYWSLDPVGVDRFTAEEATELGFPSIRLNATIDGVSWDATVYAGLRQFHEAKGFDPDSQDVARYLGEPLYQLSDVIDVPFAHVDDETLCAEEDDEGESNMDLSWCE